MVAALGLDLRRELDWARAFSRANPKNYQVWHHRQCLVALLGDECGELDCMVGDFQEEPKNYHAWQYRQWLVRTHGTGRLVDEVRLVEELLRLDPYNNSAWNHRYFLLFSGTMDGVDLARPDWWAQERAYVRAKLALDPENPSVLLYLEAVERRQKDCVPSEQ